MFLTKCTKFMFKRFPRSSFVNTMIIHSSRSRWRCEEKWDLQLLSLSCSLLQSQTDLGLEEEVNESRSMTHWLLIWSDAPGQSNWSTDHVPDTFLTRVLDCNTDVFSDIFLTSLLGFLLTSFHYINSDVILTCFWRVPVGEFLTNFKTKYESRLFTDVTTNI